MTRVTRLLLRLYPRRFRRRYRGEILDLIGELRTRGEISRGRLLRDLVGSAVSAHHPPRRSQVVMAAGLAAIAVAVLFATGTVSLGRTSSRLDPRLQAQVPPKARRLTLPRARSGSCFVGGTVCSVTGCAEFVAGQPTRTRAVTGVPLLTVTPRRRSAGHAPSVAHVPAAPHARCISDPRPRRAHAVLVGG